MADSEGTSGLDLMTMEEVCTLLRLQRRTLLNWRGLGRGPVSMKLGREVVYERADVMRWVEERRRADPLRDRAS